MLVIVARDRDAEAAVDADLDRAVLAQEAVAVAEIIERLRARPEPEASATADELDALSPTALTVTLAAVRAARELPSLRAEVEVVEPTGPDTLVFVSLNQTKVCCRLAPDVACRVGDTLNLQFDPARVLLFDAASGERLSVTGGLGAGKVTRLKGR